jgi:hypothetical protein
MKKKKNSLLAGFNFSLKFSWTKNKATFNERSVNSLEFNKKSFSLPFNMRKRLSVPGVLLPGSAEGGQPTPTSCYALTTGVLRGGVVGVLLYAGAAAAAAGPS